MCVVSMIGDHYREKWVPRPWFPYIPTAPPNPWLPPWQPEQPIQSQRFYPIAPLPVVPAIPVVPTEPPIGRKEFKRLEGEVRELIELLKRAKKYDEENGEPACELEEKMELLRRVAKMVGVDLDEMLKPQPCA